MAERRMFAKTIIDSDAFLEMPQSSQLLYFHLSIRADDDGFVNKPKTIMRMTGAKDDDMMVLCAKKFIIPFESGVCVIKHWRIHNYIQSDRYTETKYKGEKAALEMDENKAYRISKNDMYPECIQPVHELESQDRLGKDRLGKDSINSASAHKFIIPSLQDVQAYCKERNNQVNAQSFIDHYTANGWMRGKTKIKDWKACVRTWEQSRETKELAGRFDKLKKNAAYFAAKEASNDRNGN